MNKLKVDLLEDSKVYKIAITGVEPDDSYGNKCFKCANATKQEFIISMKDTSKLDKAGISIAKLPVEFGIEKKVFTTDDGTTRLYLAFVNKNLVDMDKTENTIPLPEEKKWGGRPGGGRPQADWEKIKKEKLEDIMEGRAWGSAVNAWINKQIKKEEIEALASELLKREKDWSVTINKPEQQEDKPF